MQHILKNYRRRLLNLSSSNRALVLLRLSKEQHLDVQELDFLSSQPAFSIIRSLLIGKKKLALCPYADSRYAPVAPVSRRLRNIRRKAEMIFEERGSKELYVGWPFVHGQFPDGTVVRCPLLFFPVRLQINAAQDWELQPDEVQQPQLNQSFLLAYAHYMGTPVAEPLTELDLDTLPQEPLEFRTAIYELLKEHQLKIYTGRDFFADKLIPFRDYKKADFEETLKPGQLHLEPEAVLGIFPQAASFLLADYDALLEQEQMQEMEDLFVSGVATKSGSTQAQHTFAMFEMDASQEAALQRVKSGDSVVVQGPPGTGKSQLICNLVSDFTARGKKVLVVSQKRAALDVVHQRLSVGGIGNFAVLIHDINTDRRSIYNQLAQQIEQLEEYKKQNLALNSIYTDRTFLEVSRGINQSLQKLEAFKTALFDVSRCGWSAKELYLKSNLAEPHLSLGPHYKNFTAAIIPDFLPRLKQYLQLARVFEQDDFVLKERHNLQGWGWPQRQELEQQIRTFSEIYGQLQQEIQNSSGYSFALNDLPKFNQALPTITALRELLQEPEQLLPLLQPLLQRKTTTTELKRQAQQLRDMYLVCPAPDATIPAAELEAVQAAVKTYEAQQGQLLKSISWVFSSEKKTLKQALAQYNWELNEAHVEQLQERLKQRSQAEDLMQQLNQQVPLSLNIAENPTPLLRKLEALEQALDVYNLLQELQQEEVLHQSLWQQVSLPEHLQELSQHIRKANSHYKTWLKWLPETQVQKLAAQPEYVQQLLQALQQHFEQLVSYDTLWAAFSEAEREVLRLLLAAKPASVAAGEQLFLNSLYLAWLHELELEHPQLRMPSNGELQWVEEELQRQLSEKARLTQEIVLSKLREQTYRHMEYNRLGNAVTYRRLQAQVNKKRSLYPIRKLFEQFGEEMLDLAPCWLASPETVSAVLPLQPLFDLVIFDEASQCFAETGIPAIRRGQQVVVAGDEQQLKPSDLYRARWSPEEEAEAEELTAESLLQLCGLYLPQTMLTQHYRSRYPELIEFSNLHFYKQKLELVPHFADMVGAAPALEYRHVPGVWQDNANLPEAQEVVHLVLDLLQNGQAEIGVITFNYAQQMLVQDLLEDAAFQKKVVVPPSVLVKNIENIQGDEKDVIILSVGYAPDAQGRVAMQFGSLNQAGGENRLNVAITRARHKIILLSSLLPEQLQVEQALHPGPKLLKAYLSYARQVSQGNFEYQPKPNVVPHHTVLLKDRLQQQEAAAQEGQSLQRNLPFADLTVVQQAQYKGLVLTDDDLYYSQLSVRQSHADVPRLLQARAWPYRKVYSREYWAAPQAVVERLREW
ncbi:AAA family ATPase [Pontibacter qinzhouensis]|uniref:AAA family ATPase n=1 Tax=Pontibacter qinzhouensis TaxID=2603253 RepID=A0A5C8J0I1_9BACT|nr:AAA domain-containing protein [Pontibacter qinzhouensis]TXK28257.1 AAA family ATPase [Pontibacter qinzhouensis]